MSSILSLPLGQRSLEPYTLMLEQHALSTDAVAYKHRRAAGDWLSATGICMIGMVAILCHITTVRRICISHSSEQQ